VLLFQEEVLDMAKKSIVLKKKKMNCYLLKNQGLKIALIGALANENNWGSWKLLMTKVLFQWKDFKSMKEINCYVKGADVSVGRTQFVWELKLI
jgi:beta-glucosidase